MMKRFLMCLIALCCLLPAVGAQQKTGRERKDPDNKVLGVFRDRYQAGERKASFLKKYLSLAKKSGSVRDVEMTADAYFQTLAFKRRLSPENWNTFKLGVRKYNASTFRELMERWEDLDAEFKKDALPYVETVYKQNLFYERTKKELDPEFIRLMRQDLNAVEAPDAGYLCGLLDMAVAADKGDAGTVLELFGRYADKSRFSSLTGLADLAVISDALGKILEVADEGTCKKMQAALKPYIDPKARKGLFKSLYGSIEGRLIMLGKEQGPAVVGSDLEYVDHVDGFFFNTSAGGVMTDKEYGILRQAFLSSDDSLKHHYLSKVPFAFRYNGYTKGLEDLKPLIEKNIKDCGLKDTIMALYDSYAHLAPGKMAPEFRLKDVNGREYALSDYRGKVVVVDVWATWCGGCIAKLPYFINLWKKYRNREDVEFLTISIDRKSAYNTWKYALPRYNLMEITSLIAMEGVSDFSDIYNITGIPRYFIIDRDGRIVTVYAPNPNNTAFEKMVLEVLDGKNK